MVLKQSLRPLSVFMRKPDAFLRCISIRAELITNNLDDQIISDHPMIYDSDETDTESVLL